MLARWRCEKKPIGKGDILESRLWDFYRELLYRRKNGSIFLREKSIKSEILHELGREKSKSRFDQ